MVMSELPIGDFWKVIFWLVIVWYALKGLYYLALAVWREISPAVRALWRAVKWLLYLPFAPFVALWRAVVGRPEERERVRGTGTTAVTGASDAGTVAT